MSAEMVLHGIFYSAGMSVVLGHAAKNVLSTKLAAKHNLAN